MRARLLPLLLVLSAVAGCDSTGEDALRLDADFYVGTWDLVGVADASGDRSTQALALVDELTVRFESDRSFQLDADFIDVVNQAGQEDVTVEGTYQAQPDTRVLVLVVEGVAPPFQASASTEDDVTLTAPAIIVEQLLGALQIDFEGDVRLEIERR